MNTTSLNTQELNTRPVIGILAVPSDFAEYPVDSWSYFPSSYVKHFESGGAQIVPLQYDLPRDKLVDLLERVNGVVFPGGDCALFDKKGNFTPLVKTMDFIVKYVVEQNKAGKHYPLWGTCMGFQVIAGLIQGGNFEILTHDCIGCYGVNLNNYFDDDDGTYEMSKLYAGLPKDLFEAMSTKNLSVFSHGSDFHWDTFVNSKPLNTVLRPITYTFDKKGLKYVSSYESTSMPIYATQFHPEKSTYEWKTPYYINHGSEAVRLQQYLANFFVDEARKNRNTFPDVQDYVIDNYQVTVLKRTAFCSFYFFPSIIKSIDNENHEENDSPKKEKYLFL